MGRWRFLLEKLVGFKNNCYVIIVRWTSLLMLQICR